MMEARNRTSFALEALMQVFTASDMSGKNFYGNFAIEPRIARSIDFAHAASAKRGGDFVRADSGPAGKRHRVWNDFTLTTNFPSPDNRASRKLTALSWR